MVQWNIWAIKISFLLLAWLVEYNEGCVQSTSSWRTSLKTFVRILCEPSSMFLRLDHSMLELDRKCLFIVYCGGCEHANWYEWTCKQTFDAPLMAILNELHRRSIRDRITAPGTHQRAICIELNRTRGWAWSPFPCTPAHLSKQAN